MKKIHVQLPEIKLVGITIRTNNAIEMNPSLAKIPLTIQKYFHNGLAEKILTRKNPGTTFCAYTNYESDFKGDYTYFIGEEVTSFEHVNEGFATLTIPPQNYTKFTNQPGLMPDVCVDMWKAIWTMKSSDLGGKRAYMTDFEVYDERSHNPQNTTLDVYIGVI